MKAIIIIIIYIFVHMSHYFFRINPQGLGSCKYVGTLRINKVLNPPPEKRYQLMLSGVSPCSYLLQF